VDGDKQKSLNDKGLPIHISFREVDTNFPPSILDLKCVEPAPNYLSECFASKPLPKFPMRKQIICHQSYQHTQLSLKKDHVIHESILTEELKRTGRHKEACYKNVTASKDR
jgi:hypothetical protein